MRHQGINKPPSHPYGASLLNSQEMAGTLHLFIITTVRTATPVRRTQHNPRIPKHETPLYDMQITCELKLHLGDKNLCLKASIPLSIHSYLPTYYFFCALPHVYMNATRFFYRRYLHSRFSSA